MLDLQSLVTRLAAPAGLALATVLWLSIGDHAPAGAALDALTDRLAALRPVQAHLSTRAADQAMARLAAAPLFDLGAPPGGAAPLTVKLEGLAIAGGRKAALLAINGKPPVWLELGASRDGVTLSAVSPGSVTLDGPDGSKVIGLTAAAAAASPAPDAQAPPPISDRPVVHGLSDGFRSRHATER